MKKKFVVVLLVLLLSFLLSGCGLEIVTAEEAAAREAAREVHFYTNGNWTYIDLSEMTDGSWSFSDNGYTDEELELISDTILRWENDNPSRIVVNVQIIQQGRSYYNYAKLLGISIYHISKP